MASNIGSKSVIALLHKRLNELRNIGPHSQANYKFVFEENPFDNRDEDDLSPPGSLRIVGRIFPHNTDIYGGRPVRIEIRIPDGYPGIPPEVRVLGEIFHPNVEKDGRVCHSKLFSGSSYETTMTLVDVINIVTNLLDNPTDDLHVHAEAAALFSTDRTQYNANARQTFMRNR